MGFIHTFCCFFKFFVPAIDQSLLLFPARCKVDTAKKISDTIDVSLDDSVGGTNQVSFDKRTAYRIKGFEPLEESKKQTLYDLIIPIVGIVKPEKHFLIDKDKKTSQKRGFLSLKKRV